jgi:hypothetical protein
MKKKKNWRQRALERFEENKGLLTTHLDAGDIEELTRIANIFDTDERAPFFEYKDEYETPHEAGHKGGFYLKETVIEQKELCRAKNSFLQQVFTPDVPIHLQVVVPNAPGTNDLTQVENFEVNTWFIAISRIAAELDTGLVFFEFCTSTAPLCIDIFPAPTDDSTSSLFRSALEDGIDELSEVQVVRLNTHVQKNIFRKGAAYIAVTFDDQPGLGKIFDGGMNPSRMVVDVIKGMWEDSKEEPPDGFIDAIKNYQNWPK